MINHNKFSLKEFRALFFINLKVKFINLIEYLKVIFYFYPRAHFFKIDLNLLLSYVGSNPFHMSKSYLKEKGAADLYTYGETPLTTLDRISRECQISKQDTVVELGCGRGRLCFWLHQFIGCRVIGIDYVPGFIEKAKKIVSRYQLQNIDFRLEDMFQADLKEATVIYLYGICFSDQEIEQLMQRFNYLQKGTKVITVSYALTENDSKACFKLVKHFPATFTWGSATVYLQVKN